jgi:hypothetical protein
VTPRERRFDASTFFVFSIILIGGGYFVPSVPVGDKRGGEFQNGEVQVTCTETDIITGFIVKNRFQGNRKTEFRTLIKYK